MGIEVEEIFNIRADQRCDRGVGSHGGDPRRIEAEEIVAIRGVVSGSHRIGGHGGDPRVVPSGTRGRERLGASARGEERQNCANTHMP